MKCLQKRIDCIFCRDEYCDILSDTRFNRPCPFYKRGLKEPLRDCFFEGHNGVFRNIRGYDMKYWVSEYGEVITYKGVTLTQTPDKGGELIVRLQKDKFSKHSTARVKILVADAFIPGTGMVTHVDGDINNCAAYNLRRGKKHGNEEEN